MKTILLSFFVIANSTAFSIERQFSYSPAAYCNLKMNLKQNVQSNNLNLTGMFGFPVGPSYKKLSKGIADKILRPFTSDGCSVSPDGIPIFEKDQAWVDCCVAHDTAYWLGGTRKEKELADDSLGECIKQKGYPNIGALFKKTVSKTGSSKTSMTFRWGYGWNYNRPYAVITKQEEAQVELLYNRNKKNISPFLMDQTKNLNIMCTTYDYALSGFGPVEKTIYNFLNSNLIRNDVIVSVHETSFNIVESKYEVQLSRCSSALTLTLSKKEHSIISVEVPYKCNVF